jgi:hypothetical protein
VRHRIYTVAPAQGPTGTNQVATVPSAFGSSQVVQGDAEAVRAHGVHVALDPRHGKTVLFGGAKRRLKTKKIK